MLWTENTPDFDNETRIAVLDPDELPGGPSDDLLTELEYADAFLVGGSKDVTVEETLENVRVLNEEFAGKPVYQEPGSPEQVSRQTVEEHDYLLVSHVLNGDPSSLIGQHAEFEREMERKAVEEMYGKQPFTYFEDRDVPYLTPFMERKVERKLHSFLKDNLVSQGFIIMNPECDAADEAGVEPGDVPAPEEIKGLAETAEEEMGLSIVYIEYSGKYGDPEVVETAADVLEDAHLRYGGGIETYGQVKEMLEAGADSVVVGTSLEQGRNPFRSLEETRYAAN